MDDHKTKTREAQDPEVSKLCFEYFKHFTTVTTAAALVEIALYEQLGFTRASAVLGVSISGLSLLLCIVGLVVLSVGTAAKGEILPIGLFVRSLMVGTACFFLLGVTIFAVASVNMIVINNVSHMLYEVFRGIAENIR